MRTLHGVSGAFALPILAGLWCFALLCGCEPSAQSPADGSRFDKAQAKFETQKDLPPSAKTLYSMADILATQGKDKECEFVLRRCVSQYPEFTPAYNSLAELEMRQGRVHEAIATLSKAMETRPKDPVLLNNLGMCFLIRKEYARALDQFIIAGGVVPESEKYRANMATALGLLGRHEESLALLEQVLPEDKARHNAEILHKAWERQTNPTPSPES